MIYHFAVDKISVEAGLQILAQKTGEIIDEINRLTEAITNLEKRLQAAETEVNRLSLIPGNWF